MVNAYKGLSNKLFLYGLHPLDLAITIITTIFLWMFSANVWLTVLGFIFTYFFLRGYKIIDINSRKILFRFLIAPKTIALKIEDIKTYKSCLK